jgi:hypothetical protein
MRLLFDGRIEQDLPPRLISKPVRYIEIYHVLYYPLPASHEVCVTKKGEPETVHNISSWGQLLHDAWQIIKQSQERTFECPPLEQMANQVGITRFKSPSNKKDDLTMLLENEQEPLGYSIKSEVAAQPAALNASSRTHFVYSVKSTVSTEELNAISLAPRRTGGLKRMMRKIGPDGIALVCVRDQRWEEDMTISLLEPFAEVVKRYYFEKGGSFQSLVEKLVKQKSAKRTLQLSDDAWVKRMKNFLYNVMYAVDDDGNNSASGGFIIVKSDGSLMYRSWRDIGQTKTRLFESAQVDMPSTRRHDFGYVYRHGQFPHTTFTRRLAREQQQDWVDESQVVVQDGNTTNEFRISVAALREHSHLPLSELLDGNEVLTLTRHHFSDKWKDLWECKRILDLDEGRRYINIAAGIRLKKQKIRRSKKGVV